MEIQGLAGGGDGVARMPDGLTLFVPFTAPGDRVRVRVLERRRSFGRGEIAELLEAGPGRSAPGCPAFGRCGGCRWQHIDYAAQVEAKREILGEALVRIGGWTLPDEFPFTPSPSAYGYRTRARLLVGQTGIGYRQAGSHALCAVEGCPILVPELDAELSRLAHSGELRADPKSEAEWELVADEEGRVRKHRVGPALRAFSGNSSERIEFRAGADSIAVSAGTFVQANRLLHGALHQAVLESAGQGRRALELHGGAGFFGLSLARRFETVEIVEASPGAVADLRANLERSGLGHVRVIEGDVEEVLKSRSVARPDLVLLDPPRSGLSSAATDEIIALAAARIVYLSCDPATLARDTARLRDGGYSLESIQGFDLFPQTPHVEALAVLVPTVGPQG